jgi:hypothetical protein
MECFSVSHWVSNVLLERNISKSAVLANYKVDRIILLVAPGCFSLTPVYSEITERLSFSKAAKDFMPLAILCSTSDM